jgi:microcystin-dependent protein
MPSHSHPLRGVEEDGNRMDPAGNTLAQGTPMYQPPAANPPLGAMASGMLPNSGGSQPHENIQPFLTLNFIIALTGIYPSRS